jgi:HSP20 family protein
MLRRLVVQALERRKRGRRIRVGRIVAWSSVRWSGRHRGENLLAQESIMIEQGQAVPIRIYQAAERITVAAPMPGLEPEDITITVTADGLVLRGEERGPGQHDRDLFLAEWTIGPYYREVTLPLPVDGALANATYGNGVLVVTLPKAESADRATRADFQLRAIRAARGERVAHAGRALEPVDPQQHERKHRKEEEGRKRD